LQNIDAQIIRVSSATRKLIVHCGQSENLKTCPFLDILFLNSLEEEAEYV
jgi:hypothetical protein